MVQQMNTSSLGPDLLPYQTILWLNMIDVNPLYRMQCDERNAGINTRPVPSKIVERIDQAKERQRFGMSDLIYPLVSS
jgi:hypothetical protein